MTAIVSARRGRCGSGTCRAGGRGRCERHRCGGRSSGCGRCGWSGGGSGRRCGGLRGCDGRRRRWRIRLCGCRGVRDSCGWSVRFRWCRCGSRRSGASGRKGGAGDPVATSRPSHFGAEPTAPGWLVDAKCPAVAAYGRRLPACRLCQHRQQHSDERCEEETTLQVRRGRQSHRSPPPPPNEMLRLLRCSFVCDERWVLSHVRGPVR